MTNNARLVAPAKYFISLLLNSVSVSPNVLHVAHSGVPRYFGVIRRRVLSLEPRTIGTTSFLLPSQSPNIYNAAILSAACPFNHNKQKCAAFAYSENRPLAPTKLTAARSWQTPPFSSTRFNMGRTHGVRRGTRYMFARAFRKTGSFGITKNMTIYKVGDIVDVKVRRSGAVDLNPMCSLLSPLSPLFIVVPSFDAARPA